MQALAANLASAIGRERLEEIQRARLLSATVEVVNEHGPAEAAVARIVARAGVSRRTFYELFDDRDRCYLATLDDAIERAAARVIPAYRSTDRWLERLRLALTALLAFLDDDPSTARFLIASSLAAGTEAFGRRQRVLNAVTAAVDQGRDEQAAIRHQPPPLTAEGVVGGALAIMHARLLANEPLAPLHSQMMSMIVTPYLGFAAARRELARRPAPSTTQPSRRPDADVLRELGIRLTYRTMSVLVHLAEHPGSSNRQVGNATGISDQGQISKLLQRLQRLELIENTAGPSSRGASNAWQLTTRGHNAQKVMTASIAKAPSGAAEWS